MSWGYVALGICPVLEPILLDVMKVEKAKRVPTYCAKGATVFRGWVKEVIKYVR